MDTTSINDEYAFGSPRGPCSKRARTTDDVVAYTRMFSHTYAARSVDDWALAGYQMMHLLDDIDGCVPIVNGIGNDIRTVLDPTDGDGAPLLALTAHLFAAATEADNGQCNDLAKLLRCAARVCDAWANVKREALAFAAGLVGEIDMTTVTSGLDQHVLTCFPTNWSFFSPAHVHEAFVAVLHCRFMQTQHDKRLLDDTLRIEGVHFNAWRYDVASNLTTIGLLGEFPSVDDTGACQPDNNALLTTSADEYAKIVSTEAGTLLDAPVDQIYIHSSTNFVPSRMPPLKLPCENLAVIITKNFRAMWDAMQLYSHANFVAATHYTRTHTMRFVLDATYKLQQMMRQMRIDNKRWTNLRDVTRMIKILAKFDIINERYNALSHFVPAVIDVACDHAGSNGAFCKSIASFNDVQQRFKIHMNTLDTHTGRPRVTSDELKRLLIRTDGLIVNATRTFVICVGLTDCRHFVFVELVCAAVDVSKLVDGSSAKRPLTASCFGAAQMGIRKTVRTCGADSVANALAHYESIVKHQSRTYASPANIHDDIVINTTPVRCAKKIPCALECINSVRHAVHVMIENNSLSCEHFDCTNGFCGNTDNVAHVRATLEDFCRTGSGETVAVYNAVANVHLQRQNPTRTQPHGYEPGMLGALLPNAYMCRPHVQERFNRALEFSEMTE